MWVLDIAVVPIAQQNARWVAIINCDTKHLHKDGLSKLKVELISSLLWKLKTKGWTSYWCRKAKVLYISIVAFACRVETKLSRLMSRRRHTNIWKTWIIQSICLVHLGKMVIFFTLIFRICNGDFEKYFVMVTYFYELFSLLMTVLAFLVLFEPSVTSRICSIGPSSEISTLTCMKRGTFCIFFFFL
jgi:hypothetical protein